MESIKEAAREIPVVREVDVLVVGGGPAGVGAALAAARAGADTLIVEQFNCLGGVATAGGHAHISNYCTAGRRIQGGIPWEIAKKVVAGGFGHYEGNCIDFEIEHLKLLLERMMAEAGVSILYYTFFCETLVEDGAAVGAIVQNKTGRVAIRAKRVIDCTGDGDAAASAGCPWEMGRPSDGKCQPVTLMFTIGGVDWEPVKKFRTSYDMDEVWLEAQAKGDMEPFQTHIMGWWWTPTRPDWVGINFTHVIYVDSTKAEDLTRATIEAREQCFATIDVYRKYVPGMENCYMISTPNTIGLRESRRIMGEYVLNEDDIRSQQMFDDAISYASFFVDIHHIDGPGMDHTVWRPPKGFKYQIPWRTLVPKGVENILVAGRCHSATHVALGSTRVMVPCMAMGEAAGLASAMSLDAGIAPRETDVAALQERLRAQGVILREEDIVEDGAAM